MILSVLIASIAVYSWKLLGYLIPERFITDKFRDFAERVTVSLLAAMVMIQGFTVTGEVVVDARLPAWLVAALMLWMRAPYILVVIAGAAVAAGLRMLGL
jgi:branched-subunit amino acid transport protein